MNKKIIILIFFTILLSGCTSEVNISINDDTILEEINIINFENEQQTKEQIKKSFRQYIPINKDVIVPDLQADEPETGVKYYKNELIDLGSGYQAKYTNLWKLKDYKNAKSLNSAFRSFSILKDNKEKTITISTDNNGILLFDTYLNLKKVTINVKTENDVVEANVEPHNGIYTWEFLPKEEKNIYFVIKMKDKDKNNDKQKEEKPKKQDILETNSFIAFLNKHPIFTVLICLTIFITGIVIINKITSNKYNK